VHQCPSRRCQRGLLLLMRRRARRCRRRVLVGSLVVSHPLVMSHRRVSGGNLPRLPSGVPTSRVGADGRCTVATGGRPPPRNVDDRGGRRPRLSTITQRQPPPTTCHHHTAAAAVHRNSTDRCLTTQARQPRSARADAAPVAYPTHVRQPPPPLIQDH